MRSIGVRAGLLLVVFCAACGGGVPNAGAGSVDAVRLGEDLGRRVNALCDEAAMALENVEWPGDQELTLQSAAPAIRATARVHRGLLDALSGLPASGAERDAIAELTTAGGAVVSALEGLERASVDADAGAFDAALSQVAAGAERAAATSRRVGSTTCYTADRG